MHWYVLNGFANNKHIALQHYIIWSRILQRKRLCSAICCYMLDELAEKRYFCIVFIKIMYCFQSVSHKHTARAVFFNKQRRVAEDTCWRFAKNDALPLNVKPHRRAFRKRNHCLIKYGNIELSAFSNAVLMLGCRCWMHCICEKRGGKRGGQALQILQVSDAMS